MSVDSGSVSKKISRLSALLVAVLAVAGSQVVSASSPALAAPACTINGTAGQDVLTGGPGADVICGLGDADHLVGGGGSDHLLGGAGNDTLDGRDASGNVDVLDCGSGTADRAFADQRDQVSNCEIVTQENTSPKVTLAPSTVAENEPVGTEVGQLGVTDGGPVGEYQFSLVAGPGGGDNASFTLSGRSLLTAASFDYEADNEFSIRVRATDRSRTTFEQFFTVTVTDINENTAPTDIALSNASVAENEPVATTVGALSATDADAGDTHTFTLVAGAGDDDNASFQVDGSALRTNAVFDFETESSYSIRIQADDGQGGTFEEQFTVTVTDAADAPTDISLSSASVAEGMPLATTVGTLSATDPDTGDTHAFTMAAGTGDTDNASFTVTPGGALKTNAVFDFETTSSHAIRVRATDQGGTFFEKQFTITITNANEAPTDVSVTPSTVDENQPVGSTVGTLASIDPDTGDTFTYTLEAGAGDGDNGSFTITAGGLLKTNATFDSESDSSYSIRVRTTDAGGLHVEKALTITVSNVNEAPVATDNSYAAPPAGLVVPAPGVLGDDTDPEGSALTATLVTGPTHTSGPGGSFTLDPDGGFSYTPATGTVATTDSFTYRAVDPGTLTSDIATVTLALNQPPVAVDDAATTPEDTFVDIDVSANDTDAETANAGLTATSIAAATGGSAVLQPGSRIIRFTPDEDFTGTASFTYHAYDGASSSLDPATVTITVDGTNDAPQISDSSAGATYLEQNNIAAPVSGDAVVSDVDSADLASATLTIDAPLAGDELTFLTTGNITGNLVGGVLTLSGSATLADYQTAIRSVGFRNASNEDPGTTRTITVKVNDGSVDSNVLTRTITITAVNDAPVVTTSAGTTSADEQVATVIDGGITVTDPDSMITDARVDIGVGYQPEDVLTLPGQPLPGGITASQTGSLLSLTGTTTAANYQAALRAVTYTNTSSTPIVAPRTIRFQVTDNGTPAMNSVVVTRTIQPVDVPESAPPTDGGETYETNGNTWLWVAQPAPGSAKPMRTSSINLLDNATDPDTPAGGLTAVNPTQGAHGEVSLNDDGSFLYIPDVGYTGPDSFTYQVSDGTGLSAPSTVNITVDHRIWYVSNAGTPFGDGTSGTPFQSLEKADVAADSAGDIIYVRYGIGGDLLYDLDVDLMQGQQLLGEGVDLVVGGVTLFDVVEGSNVPLIDLTVNMDSGNTVRGLWWVGTHDTPAIAGNAGDNGGTIMDVLIQGGRPGIELVGTTGDWTFWDATVDVTAPTGYALRAENAGVLTFRDNGTNAFGGKVGGAVKILSTVTTGTIDSVTAKADSGTGIDIQNTGGDLTIGSVDLTTTDTALRLDNADAITIDGGTATSTGGVDGISVTNSNNSSITIPSGSLSGNGVTAFSVSGGTGDITFGGSIGNVATPTGGYAVSIADHESGAIRLTGQIASNGSVSVGGGQSAPVEITGTNNVIAAGAGTALSVSDQLVGSGGIRFRSLTATGGAYGIELDNTTGGPISVTGSGSAGSGGTLRTVHLDGTAGVVTLDGLDIVTGANNGVEANNARSLILRNSAISGAGNGVVLKASEGLHDYVVQNTSITLSPSLFNRGIELTNPIFTSPTTNIWLLGNSVSGAKLDSIALFARGTSRVVGQITDNQISNYGQTGLWLINTGGTADTDYTVTGNTITDTFNDPTDSVRTGMAVESGRFDNPTTSGRDGGLLCLDATGNALSTSGLGNPGDFLLRVAYDAKFFIPGLGSSSPGPLFATRNNANGSPDGEVIDSADGTAGFYTGTCDILGAPPA